MHLLCSNSHKMHTILFDPIVTNLGGDRRPEASLPPHPLLKSEWESFIRYELLSGLKCYSKVKFSSQEGMSSLQLVDV